MPRILILSASVGAGHLRAAQALELALRELSPESYIQNTDVLTLTSPLFRRLYGKAYIDLVNLAPHLLGAFYDLSDVVRTPTRRGDQLRRLAQRVNLSKVISLLGQKWDLVVNTHFLPAQIIALRRRRNRLRLRHVTVVTDFDAHAFWTNSPTDRYFVATEEAALSLGHWGVERGTIEVTGIPVHPVFAKPKSALECRAKHSLDPSLPTILLLAGGFGVGPIEKIYRALLELPAPVQIVAVAGRNAALKTKLSKAAVPARHKVSLLGFTAEIDELMAAADLLVTKPSGLTTSEALARGCAMVIANPIPGQESRNSDYLLEHSAAIKINSLSSLTWKLQTLLEAPARLAQIRANAAALGHPRSAYDIGVRALEMVGG
jgi:processive 1,2-diacylglycerol beta-glucosyltransferase